MRCSRLGRNAVAVSDLGGHGLAVLGGGGVHGVVALSRGGACGVAQLALTCITPRTGIRLSLAGVELLRDVGVVSAARSAGVAQRAGNGVIGPAQVVGASGGVGGVGVGVVGALRTGICLSLGIVEVVGLAGCRVARVVPAFLEAPGIPRVFGVVGGVVGLARLVSGPGGVEGVVAGGAVAEVREVVADVVVGGRVSRVFGG
ncbi:hypothetical protein, partial [Microbispora hainanensis]|uniref:hypothetical protein n=1 Tax=Microbispora hainanensis TaxID=568844 RepID=UPI0033C0497A